MPKSSHIHYYDEIQQGTEEWQKLKDAKFSGSNAYKLLTSFGAGKHAMGSISEWGGNFATQRGHTLEDEAIELYNLVKGVTVKHTGLVTNDKYPFCVYSPDGYLPRRTIEVKCFFPKKHLETIKYIDLKIKAQCYFGQMILEKGGTDLILYCPKPKNWIDEIDGEFPVPVDKMLYIVRLPKDDAIINNFKRIVQAYNG